MKITKLITVDIPRVVRQYEDRFVVESLFQAEVEYKSKNGNDTKAYIFHYPYYSYCNDLPKFFITNTDTLEYIETHRYAGYMQEFCRTKIRKSWDCAEDAVGTQWEEVIALLSLFDINSRSCEYFTNIILPHTNKTKYIFDWNTVSYENKPFCADSGEKLIRITEQSYLSDIDLSDYTGVFIECDNIETLSGEFANSRIQELVLPSSLKRIEKDTFSGCKNLEHLCVPRKCKLFLDDFKDITQDPITIHFI